MQPQNHYLVDSDTSNILGVFLLPQEGEREGNYGWKNSQEECYGQTMGRVCPEGRSVINSNLYL